MSNPITAKMVNDLRVATGAGLLDCKKALTEANGNIEEASTILRKKGAASAAPPSLESWLTDWLTDWLDQTVIREKEPKPNTSHRPKRTSESDFIEISPVI